MKTCRRLVTCQGSIQLAAALSALNYRMEEQQSRNYNYEDHLVIYDLYAPFGQSPEFAQFITKMAREVMKWKSITYLLPEQINVFIQTSNKENGLVACAEVRDLLSVGHIDEIYLPRNWQFTNELLINAFSNAIKICYGDAIGINISESYFAPAPLSQWQILKENFSPGFALFMLKAKVNSLFTKQEIPIITPDPSSLKKIEFDIGYFLLGNILGDTPTMKNVVTISRKYILEIFKKCVPLIETDAIVNGIGQHSSGDITILMSSNFSEASKMTETDEINGYKEYLLNLKLSKKSTLVIKPHPRDGKEKLVKIKDILKESFENVILLDSNELFFLPFEIFFLKAFAPLIHNNKNIKVITFSTACFSFPLFFGIKPYIGFGSKLTQRYFVPSQRRNRLSHERDLAKGLKFISRLSD